MISVYIDLGNVVLDLKCTILKYMLQTINCKQDDPVI